MDRSRCQCQCEKCEQEKRRNLTCSSYGFQTILPPFTVAPLYKVSRIYGSIYINTMQQTSYKIFTMAVYCNTNLKILQLATSNCVDSIRVGKKSTDDCHSGTKHIHSYLVSAIYHYLVLITFDNIVRPSDLIALLNSLFQLKIYNVLLNWSN